MMRRVTWLLLTVTLILWAVPPSEAQDDFVPVTDAMLQNPAPGDWLMWRRTVNGWG